MRRWTLITIIVLAAVLIGAAIWQFALIASNDPPPGRPATPTVPGP